MIVSNWVTSQLLHRTRFGFLRQAFGVYASTMAVSQTTDRNQSDLVGFSLATARVRSTVQTVLTRVAYFSQSSNTFLSDLPRWFRFLPNLTIGVSLLIFLVVFAPEFYYRFVPVESIVIRSAETGSPLGGDFSKKSWWRDQLSQVQAQFGSQALPGSDGAFQVESIQSDQPEQSDHPTPTPEPAPTPPTRYLPPQDPTLPEGEWITIPRIGVRTQLRETHDPEEAMQLGVWKVPDFGDPGQLNYPMIVAAHRFGWDWWWQSDYWKYHSFYLLPDTEPGDRVEIIADQRKWVYEMYAGEEGEEISDYEADLILYTCKFLTSPIRHFRYARLINPEANTQQPGI